ncbi:MAG TPA: YraN family protein [Actinomycetota bacterium]
MGDLARTDLGRIGEDTALARYLDLGYRLVARNWRCRLGELDLVVSHRERNLLVFCEVKCRRGRAFGEPFEAVHHAKQRKLRDLAQAFLQAGPPLADSVRFDVASVTVDGSGRARVDVFEDAF